LLTQNPARRHEWDYRIQKAELIDANEPRKGAKFRSMGSLLGPFQLEMVYVTAELNQRSAVKLVGSKGLPFKSGGGSWHYKDLGNGRSRFETNIRMKTDNTWVGKIVDRFCLQPFLKWMTLKSMKKLKAVAENDYKGEE
jgi:hypothetical protein